MSETYVFRFVGDSLSNLSVHYVEKGSAALAGALGPIALAGITLFIVIYGLMVVAGKVQSPLQDLAVKILKMMIIAGIALNGALYMSAVVGTIEGVEALLVEAMSIPGSETAESIYASLDNSLARAGNLAATAMEEANKKPAYDIGGMLPWLFAGGAIYVGMFAFFIVGGAYIVCVKFALAIVLALGPLFIMALLWAPTAGFFDRWIGQVLTYVFTTVLVSMVLSMGIQIFDLLISKSVFDDQSQAAFVAVQILFTGAILAFVVYQVGTMAAALAGGAGMGALSMRQLAGAVSSPITAAGRALNPMSNRLDPSTGLQTRSPRLEHIAMGRTVFSPNPIYRQAVMSRLRQTAFPSANSVTRK